MTEKKNSKPSTAPTLGELRAQLPLLLQIRSAAEQALIEAAILLDDASLFDLRFTEWRAADQAVTLCETQIRDVFTASMQTRQDRRIKAQNDAYLEQARRLNAAMPPARTARKT